MSDEKIARRVVARFLGLSMEHANPEALKKYLHEHPDADKSKHHVKEQGGDEPKGEDKPAEKKKPRTRSEIDDAHSASDWEFKDELSEARGDHALWSNEVEDLKDLPNKYIRDLSDKMPNIGKMQNEQGWPEFGNHQEKEADSFYSGLLKELNELEQVMKDNKDQTNGRVPSDYTELISKTREKAKKMQKATEKAFNGFDNRLKGLRKEEEALDD